MDRCPSRKNKVVGKLDRNSARLVHVSHDTAVLFFSTVIAGSINAYVVTNVIIAASTVTIRFQRLSALCLFMSLSSHISSVFIVKFKYRKVQNKNVGNCTYKM